MKYVLFALMLLHGLLHLLGFVKAYGLAEIKTLKNPISKSIGTAWLISAMLLIAGGFMLLSDNSLWWIMGFLGLVISQGLIIRAWRDAKFGTIANILIAVGCVLGYGQWEFNSKAKEYVETFLDNSKGDAYNLSEADLNDLPEVVATWVRNSGALNKPYTSVIKMVQAGQLKTDPSGDWHSVTANQWTRTMSPGFIWVADVGWGGLSNFSGRDLYTPERSQMLIKLYGSIPLVDQNDEGIAQGAAIRYLAEIVWSPATATADFITWESISTYRAKATLNDGERTVEGVFTFSPEGFPVRFEAQRVYDETGNEELWIAEMDKYRAFNGITIPTAARITWKLPDGDFTWYTFELDEADYGILLP